MTQLARLIRDIPDFPRKGILFKDITPMLRDAAAFGACIEALRAHHAADRIDAVAAIESRGFVFGGALALRLEAGFIPIRKAGKLPHDTLSETYALEYGTDTVQIHRDAVSPGDRILLLDDLLATGGTARAAVRLIRQLGGEVVGATFVVELDFLHGRRHLDGTPVHSLIHYDA
jgi:adenine phosphoribosyltransferase